MIIGVGMDGGKRVLHYKKEVEDKWEEFLRITPEEFDISNIFVGRDGTYCPLCEKKYNMLDNTHVVEDVEMFIRPNDGFPRPSAYLFTLCRACATTIQEQGKNDPDTYEESLRKIDECMNKLYAGVLKPEEERKKEMKLVYKDKIEIRKRERTRKYTEHGYTIDNCLMEYFNHECFSCGNPFELKRNRVNNADGILIHSDTNSKIAFPHVQCKTCMDKVSRFFSGSFWLKGEVDSMQKRASDKIIEILYETRPNQK